MCSCQLPFLPSALSIPDCFSPQGESSVHSVRQQTSFSAWVLVSTLLRAALIGSLICQEHKLVSSYLSNVIGASDLWARAETWAPVTSAWLGEQWCEPIFNLIFIHIWPCLRIYAALSNIQCHCKMNDTHYEALLSPGGIMSPVTSFLAHITL